MVLWEDSPPHSEKMRKLSIPKATENMLKPIQASRVEASVFGMLAGLGGLTHGIGEILQGNVAPSGIFIPSWTQGPIADYMGGEPGLTIVPNLLVTGILASLVSLAVIVWSVAYVTKKKGGVVLILLSVAMLLLGGGVGPPIIGILAGVAGLGIRSSLSRWRNHLSEQVLRVLAGLWPWIFGICVLNAVFLVIGSLILVYGFEFNNPELFVNSFFIAVISMVLTIICGVAYDIRHRERHLLTQE